MAEVSQRNVRGWWHSHETLQTHWSTLCLLRSCARLTPPFLPVLPSLILSRPPCLESNESFLPMVLSPLAVRKRQLSQ